MIAARFVGGQIWAAHLPVVGTDPARKTWRCSPSRPAAASRWHRQRARPAAAPWWSNRRRSGDLPLFRRKQTYQPVSVRVRFSHWPYSEAIHRYETIRGGTRRRGPPRAARIFAGWSGSDRGPQRVDLDRRGTPQIRPIGHVGDRQPVEGRGGRQVDRKPHAGPEALRSGRALGGLFRVPAVDAAELSRAVAACRAVAAACGLRVDDAVVLNDSNRLAVHLRPCDVLARVAPRARQNGAEFEVEVARRLAETGAPLATLDPRVEPRVYEQDDFAVTLWTYYEPVPPHDIAPDEYASALERLHAGMRQADADRRLAAALHGSSRRGAAPGR